MRNARSGCAGALISLVRWANNRKAAHLAEAAGHQAQADRPRVQVGRQPLALAAVVALLVLADLAAVAVGPWGQ